MASVHFQSIYRRTYRSIEAHVFCEPLCEQEPFDGIELSPLRSEVTCPACLGFLMRIKESTSA